MKHEIQNPSKAPDVDKDPILFSCHDFLGLVTIVPHYLQRPRVPAVPDHPECSEVTDTVDPEPQ